MDFFSNFYNYFVSLFQLVQAWIEPDEMTFFSPDFLFQTLEPQNFWAAFSSIATFIGLIIAFWVPLRREKQRSRRARRAILLELRSNRKLLGDLVHVSNSREAKWTTKLDEPYATAVAELISRISFSSWEAFGPDIDDDRRTCFGRAYALLDVLRSPNNYFAIPGFDQPHKRLEVKLYECSEVANEFDLLVRSCRYLQE